MGLRERTPPTAERVRRVPHPLQQLGSLGRRRRVRHAQLHHRPRCAATPRSSCSEGRAISCSRPIDTHSGPANPYPARHLVAVHDSGEMADFLSMFVHGFAETHLDALCHLAGGRAPSSPGTASRSTSTTCRPSTPGTIDFWRDGIVTRGVLYDIPRLRGHRVRRSRARRCTDGSSPTPPPRRASSRAPATRCSSAAGYGPYFETHGGQPGFLSPAGVHASCIEFLYEHDASMLVWDMQDAPIADQGIPNPRAIRGAAARARAS